MSFVRKVTFGRGCPRADEKTRGHSPSWGLGGDSESIQKTEGLAGNPPHKAMSFA